MSTLEYESKEQPAALLEFKAKTGQGTALFSRYNMIDLDNDVTRENFIPSGIMVPMLVGHVWSSVPVAKGRIRSERDGAYYDFVLSQGRQAQELREWFLLDLSEGQTPKSEFSYGFTVLEGGSSRGLFEGKSVRFLHGREDGPGCTVHEISYTLKGAGISTALISMKGEQRYRWAQRHAELTAWQATRQRAEQATFAEMYRRFAAREREWRGR